MKTHILFLLSVFLVPFLGLSQVMHGKIDHTKVLRFNDHYFRFSKPTSINIMGKPVLSAPNPVEVNGERIYRSGYETDNEPELAKNRRLSDYLKSRLSPLLRRLPDGVYAMETNTLVIDKEGKLIYFDYRELTYVGRDESTIQTISESGITQAEMEARLISIKRRQHAESSQPAIPERLKREIGQTMYHALIHAPRFTPAKAGGKNVYCILDPLRYDFTDRIVVTSHQVSFVN